MNDEEIMKKFNEKFSDDNPTSTSVEKEFGDVAPYKVSENNNNNNINTPQPNSDNHTPMSVNSLLEKDNRTYYTNDNGTDPNSGSNYNSNVNYTYVPTYKSTQNKKNTIKITSDIKTLLVLVFILFIFILVVPSIYDFIREIKMG